MTKPNPKAVGLKALVASGRFSLSACRVGLALLDHYNLDTGRCDPGKGRIAFELDIALTSVKTALKELTDGPDRLFDLQRGVGGASNAYVPRWEPIYAIVRAFEARGRTKDWQSAKKAEDEARGRAESRPTKSKCLDGAESRPRVGQKAALGGAENRPMGRAENRPQTLLREPVEGTRKREPLPPPPPDGGGFPQGGPVRNEPPIEVLNSILPEAVPKAVWHPYRDADDLGAARMVPAIKAKLVALLRERGYSHAAATAGAVRVLTDMRKQRLAHQAEETRH